MNRNTRKSSSSAAAAAGNSQNSNNNNAVVVNKQQQDERRFADESVSALAMPQVGSVSVKNVTSKSGFTQRAHHVCKNVTFEVRVASASSAASLDLTQCVVACQLVYDGRTAPLKLVDLPNATPMRYTALVEPHCVTLSVKIGVLSSQVDGELFRLKITATETNNNSNTVHVAYSAPIAIVSKPYLALRAEGDRSKPKPLSHRQQQQQHVSSSQSSSSSSAAGATTTTKSNRTTTSAASSFRPSSATSAPNDLLAIVMSEQAAQRRLLEQLLAQRNPQQQQQQHQLTSEDDEHEDDDSAAATTTTPSEERASKRRRDETDDDDDDEEFVPTSSSTASTTAQLRQSKRRRVVARKSLSKLRQQRDESSIDEDDNDNDNNEPAIELITNIDNNNADEDDDASSMSATTMPTPTTETTTMSTQKQFVAALEAFVGAFDELTASGDVASRNATLSALLPTRVVEAIRASNGGNGNGNGDAACALFADGRCPHRRELERLDAMYELSLNINNSMNNTKKRDSNRVDLSYQNNNNAVVKAEPFGFKSSIDDDLFLDADSSAIDNLVLNF